MIDSHSYPPFIRTLRRLRGAFWRRRFLHWFVRAAWLALLVPTAVMIGYLWFDQHVSWNVWVTVMALVAFCSLLWSLRPISIQKMARRLDRLLDMQSQLVAAFEVSHKTDDREDNDTNPVAEHLVQDAVSMTVGVRRQISMFGRGFWLELHTLIAVIAILLSMLIFDILTARIPDANAIDLPPPFQEPSADEINPPDPVLNPPPFQEPQVETLTQAQVQAALEALSDALRDQAVSRSVSDALDRGNISQAAENLRQMADQLDQLSRTAQQELGSSLQEASDNVGNNFPSLSEASQSGSDALGDGNMPAAGRALEEMADLLDALEENSSEAGEEPGEAGEPGEEPGEGGEGEQGGDEEGEAGDGDASAEGEGEDQMLEEEEERLPIDGEPLELESDPELDDQVLQPSELDALAGDERTEDSPFARQPLNAPGDDLGPDSLSYPWEKRDIIRHYFTP